jgi:hypothetical protein
MKCERKFYLRLIRAEFHRYVFFFNLHANIHAYIHVYTHKYTRLHRISKMNKSHFCIAAYIYESKCEQW